MSEIISNYFKKYATYILKISTYKNYENSVMPNVFNKKKRTLVSNSPVK